MSSCGVEPWNGKVAMPKLAVMFFSRSSGSDATQAAQLAGELARLFDVGFGHQDDEFVAAVAGDDVGAAAILFEDVADALKNDVAFEVAVEIVDELEAVQVDQDQREWAAGARGALPFRGERFHEEAVRLYAGEAVGDGLLLSFLERERIVERAGESGRRACASNCSSSSAKSHGSRDST